MSGKEFAIKAIKEVIAKNGVKLKEHEGSYHGSCIGCAGHKDRNLCTTNIIPLNMELDVGCHDVMGGLIIDTIPDVEKLKQDIEAIYVIAEVHA